MEPGGVLRPQSRSGTTELGQPTLHRFRPCTSQSFPPETNPSQFCSESRSAGSPMETSKTPKRAGVIPSSFCGTQEETRVAEMSLSGFHNKSPAVE